jgi:two-component system chemotaxis response regulator CheB
VNVIRVLVVDDSPTVRAVLTRMLTTSPRIEVVGESGDGRDAVRRCAELEPDAILLDLDLPGLSGVDVARAIADRRPVPILVVSARLQGQRIVDAFKKTDCGVVAVFEKPEVPEAWERLGEDLRTTLLQLQLPRSPDAPSLRSSLQRRSGLRFVAVGASTGGPAALRRLLGGLDRRTRLGIAVVQHITSGFETGLARWLAGELERDVRVAREGDALGPGVVRIAPPESHLTLSVDGRLYIDRDTGSVNGHRPSIDRLFLSLAKHRVEAAAAVVLSGLGSDGAEGMALLARRGTLTLVQDRASCVVFGMPQAALRRGAGELELAPEEIAAVLDRAAGGSG